MSKKVAEKLELNMKMPFVDVSEEKKKQIFRS